MWRSSDARGRTLRKARSYLQLMLQKTLLELVLACPVEKQKSEGTLPVSIKSSFKHASGQLWPGKNQEQDFNGLMMGHG